MFNKCLGYEVSKTTMRDTLHQAEQARLAQIVPRRHSRLGMPLARLSLQRQDRVSTR